MYGSVAQLVEHRVEATSVDRFKSLLVHQVNVADVCCKSCTIQ